MSTWAQVGILLRALLRFHNVETRTDLSFDAVATNSLSGSQHTPCTYLRCCDNSAFLTAFRVLSNSNMVALWSVDDTMSSVPDGDHATS